MKCYVCFTCAFSTIIKDRFEKCPVCNNELSELTGRDRKEFLNLRKEDRVVWIENKTNQLISDELKQKKTTYILGKKQELQSSTEIQNMSSFNAAMAHGKAVLEGKDKGNPYGMACPYCHATNIKKISTASRMISTGLFGLGSKKIGKQWHCCNCGSDF